MAVKEAVLAFLREQKGAYVSGEKMANALGVSRAAVWKGIKALEEEGYAIEGVRNQGYRILESNDVLSAEGIREYLQVEEIAWRPEVYKSVTSTNDVVRERALAGEMEGLAVLAEEQSAGRGRCGRSFYSPFGTGIYMSMLLRPTVEAKDAQLMTTAAAVATAEAIEEVCGERVEIKWVNDLFLNGKKVCGILTEANLSVETGGVEFAVVGIGINTVMPMGGFPAELYEVANALRSYREGNLRNRLAAAILKNFARYYKNLPQKEFWQGYRERLLGMGREVETVRGECVRTAKIVGLDEEFRLLVEYADGGRETLSSGEIRIRL